MPRGAGQRHDDAAAAVRTLSPTPSAWCGERPWKMSRGLPVGGCSYRAMAACCSAEA